MRKIFILSAVLFFVNSIALSALVNKKLSQELIQVATTNDTEKINLQIKLLSQLTIQNNTKADSLIHSLFKDISLEKNDEHKIKNYYNLSHALIKRKAYKKAFEAYSMAMNLSRNLKNNTWLQQLYYLAYHIKINELQSHSAIPYLDSAILYCPKNDVAKQALLTSEIGRCYYDIGDYPSAMSYYLKSQSIFEKNKIKNESYAHLMHFIGSVFKRQNIDDKAMDYYKKMLVIAKEINSPIIEAEGLYLLADLYAFKGDAKKDKEYLLKALSIYEKIENKEMQSLMYLNLAHGEIYRDEYDSALVNLKKAEQLTKNKSNLITINRYFGKIYSALDHHKKSMTYFNKAKEIAYTVEQKKTLNLTDIHRNIAYAYYKNKNYKEAFEELELFIDYQDSLFSEENRIVIHNLEQRYENKKKESKIMALNKDKEIAKKELGRQVVVKNAFIGGFILMILLAGSIFFSLKQNKKKNKIITIQKIEVEEKNREILDSINYAKRIQAAILPQEKLVKEYLKNSFILYKPKDIVAGDFYWMENKDGKILFAAADCTGHGVPGAMVSVICNNGLNRAVREYGLTTPGEILDKARDIVLEEFDKSEDDVNDGMDIAICSLHNNTLEYAGANNPLWIIRNQELIEYKGDKQPIGKFYNPYPYNTHKIELQKSDTIYIFSDGFADQFGGDKGKKFKTANFKELILSVQKENMQTQKEIIDRTFIEWKGNLEQIDDVCVIGVRV